VTTFYEIINANSVHFPHSFSKTNRLIYIIPQYVVAYKNKYTFSCIFAFTKNVHPGKMAKN